MRGSTNAYTEDAASELHFVGTVNGEPPEADVLIVPWSGGRPSSLAPVAGEGTVTSPSCYGGAPDSGAWCVDRSLLGRRGLAPWHTAGSSDSASLERRVADAAAGQHGIVTRPQLLMAGLAVRDVRAWRRSGRLVPVHRGVYVLGSLVGPLRPARYREMAAVLACGRGAAVGHWSALWLRGLVAERPGGPDGAIHLVLAGGRCRHAGIVAHRVSGLPSDDVDVVDGIPTTTAARTILDVAGAARPRTLEQVIASAERLGFVDRKTLLERLERAGPIRGARLLRSILDAATDPAFTRSVAEERLLDLIRRAGLPEPRSNVRVGSFELDFLWPEHGVTVEVDGFAYHSSRRAFERDRDRDFDLATKGVQVLRVTWRQLEETPYVVIRRLASMLARAEVARGGGRGD